MTSRLTGAAETALAIADDAVDGMPAVIDAAEDEGAAVNETDEVGSAEVVDSTGVEVPLMGAAGALANGRAGGCWTSSLGE